MSQRARKPRLLTRTRRRWLWLSALAAVLVVFNAWALSRPWCHHVEPLFTWRKGPLIKESCPYSAFHAARYLWPALAVALDLYLLSMVGWFRAQRRLGGALAGRLTPLAIALALALSLGVAEVGVRAAIHRWQYTQYRPDPDLFWYNRPLLRDHVDETDGVPRSTNSLGFRGVEEILPKRPGEVRVFIVGDSSTFGLGVPDQDVYGFVMERRLEQITGRPVTVADTASPGHTSYQGSILWQRHADLVRPDLLIWAYNNDSCLDMVAERDRLAHSPAVLAAERVLYRSDLYLMAREVALGSLRSRDVERFKATYPEEVSGWVKRIPFPEYQSYLEEFDRSARARGARAIFVRMPLNRASVKETDIFKTSFDDAYRDYLSGTFCAAPERACLDAEKMFLDRDYRDLFLPQHLFHPSRAGHAIIGETLARLVVDRGLLPPAVSVAPPAGGAP